MQSSAEARVVPQDECSSRAAVEAPQGEREVARAEVARAAAAEQEDVEVGADEPGDGGDDICVCSESVS